MKPRVLDHEGSRMGFVIVAAGFLLGVPVAWAAGSTPDPEVQIPDAMWETAFPDRRKWAEPPGLHRQALHGLVLVEPEPEPEGLMLVQEPPQVVGLTAASYAGEGAGALRDAFWTHRHALVACTGSLEEGSFTLYAEGRVEGIQDRFTRACVQTELRSWGLSGEAQLVVELQR